MADGSMNDGTGCQHDGPRCRHTVEDHAQKVLVVKEADAVGNPGAMMVHLENTSIALRAVMTPVRFSLVAPLTDPYSSVPFLLYLNNNFTVAAIGWLCP
jgi:hypothetical protein